MSATTSLDHKELTRRLDGILRSWRCVPTPHWRAASFMATTGEPMPIRRAKALNAVLERSLLPLVPGELLIGAGVLGRCAPEGTVSADELAADRAYLATMPDRDFQTHRDHHAPGYARLLRVGLGGLKSETRDSLARHDDPRERAFLESVLIALDGASRYMLRWADRCDAAARETPEHSALLADQARRMRRLAEEPASSFHDALQLTWSFHAIMQIDDRHAMAFGRLDQFLYPCYAADLAAGSTTPADALRLLEHFFARITVTPDVQNIALGGVRPEDGLDATNDLSHLILEACRRVGRPGGNCTARVHKNTPQDFLRKCGEVIRSGIGYPALYNDEVQIPALTGIGYPLHDARDYCFAGCIEVFIPGRMAPWADGRFNLLHCVDLALRRGIDGIKGQRLGPDTGEPEDFEGFYRAWLTQMRFRLDVHVERLNARKSQFDARASECAAPLLSALTADCIARGRDLNDGGARHPANHGIAGMGIGVTADSLAAVKRFVYERRQFTLAGLRRMLNANFAGCERERRLLLSEAPKYGNGDDEVDAIAARVTQDFGVECMKHRTPRGGWYWGLMAANVSNIAGGREVGASPDGRLAMQPLSDAASPTFGRDLAGLTAVIRSVSRLPYAVCPGGNVVNVKLHPSAIAGDKGLDSLASLVRTGFDLGAVQFQFNTVDRRILEEAVASPDEHRGLVVRVSGFSSYFVSLDRAVQEDILARTEHR